MSVSAELGAAAIFLPLVLLSHLLLSTPLYPPTNDALARCSIVWHLVSPPFGSPLAEALGRLSRISLAFSFWIAPHLWEIRSYNCSNDEPTTSQMTGPWLLPCATTHTRQFPRKHSFKYSYLQVAFKVGSRQTYGRILSLDQADSSNRPWTWFSVYDEDYLSRGQCQDGLRGKLDFYLTTEGIDHRTLPNAYLVTAPRFLGYSFNPVSFWYLYNAKDELEYMILEVNNTFDERRMYLLEKGPISTDKGDSNSKPVFRQTWPKDFHVSPFSSRKGSYSLVAHEPVWSDRSSIMIDNTITLKSSKEHAKLVARLFSTAPAKNVKTFDVWDAAKFIFGWFWVGFVTFPRILKEAAKLFFARKLHVWYRPEVRVGSIGRKATDREEVIARVFEAFMVQQSAIHGIKIDYSSTMALSDFSPDNPVGEDSIGSPHTTKHGYMRLHVSSPMFYAQYARDPDYIEKSLRQPPEERLFSLDETDPAILSKVFSWGRTPRMAPPEPPGLPLALRLLRKLSRSQHPMDYLVLQKDRKSLLSHAAGRKKEARSIEQEGELRHRYVRAVQALLISDWLAFGVPEILDAAGWLIRLCLLWWALNHWTEVPGRVVSSRSWDEAQMVVAASSWPGIVSLVWAIGAFRILL